jgi:hypothetical protein
MMVDKAPANSNVLWTLKGGDTGRGRVEHSSFLKLRFTHLIKTGQSNSCLS